MASGNTSLSSLYIHIYIYIYTTKHTQQAHSSYQVPHGLQQVRRKPHPGPWPTGLVFVCWRYLESPNPKPFPNPD